MLDTSLQEWEPLTEEKLLTMLAQKLREGSIHGTLAEVVGSRTKGFSPSSSTPVAEASTTTGNDSEAKRTMVRTLSEKPLEKSLPHQERFKLQLILFLDSGGQPQFHEVLPALSHKIGLIMLFLKLNECLDDLCCTTFTNEKGENYSVHSSLTNKQMLVQLVHTMMSKVAADGKRPKVMVVGTHFDLIHDCSETLDQKNAALPYLFRGVKELITDGDDIIFPVNALNPDKKSEEVFGKIRYVIEEVSFSLEQETPLSWFLFQNDLIKHGLQKKGVVSKKECLDIAGKLKMDSESLQGALNHFNDLSIFLYTSNIPHLVFTDPQMSLKVVNECVAFAYKVQCGKGPPMTKHERSCWKEGTITSEMLERREFSSCFVHSVFNAGHALKFFQNLHIVAPIGESEFIMPCILPLASDTEIENHLPQCDENVAILLVIFPEEHIPNGHIPNGIFCAIHNCMRSIYKWTTYYERKPTTYLELKEVELESIRRKVENDSGVAVACLYRNMVKLQHPEEAVRITLVHDSNLRHFEVHVETEEKDILPDICPKILHNILNSISIAEHAFQFKESGATEAFLCPCGIKRRHAAILNRKRTSLKCTDTSRVLERKCLKEGHMVWLKG